MRLAEAVHELESLTVYYRHILDSMQQFGESGDRVSEAGFNAMQHAFPFVTTRALGIVERLFEAAGASADPRLQSDAALLA